MLSRSSKSEDEASRPSGPPTIATLAAHLGLSRATVTHVLNGRAEEQRIRPETRERVLAVAAELGYRANASARAVRAGRFGSVALLQSRLGQYLPDELLSGLSAGLAAERLQLVLTEVPNVDVGGESLVARAMRELSVDGVLVNRHGGTPTAFLERIQELRIPAVFLNTKQAHDCVHPDDLGGGRLATGSPLSLGHRRIAYVGSEPVWIPHYSEADRLDGYASAMGEAGGEPVVCRLPFAWQAPGGADDDQRVLAALGLLSGERRPTAIVAYGLRESMAVLHAAQRLGLRLPSDLSLIHFHHRLDDQFGRPIHTVSNGMRPMGEAAVELLLEKIAHPERPLPPRVVPEQLLPGATCAPPRPVGEGKG